MEFTVCPAPTIPRASGSGKGVHTGQKKSKARKSREKVKAKGREIPSEQRVQPHGTEFEHPGDGALSAWEAAEREYGRAVKRALADPDRLDAWTTDDVVRLVALRIAAARSCDLFFRQHLSSRVPGL